MSRTSLLYFLLAIPLSLSAQVDSLQSRRVHKALLTIDTHCDTPLRLSDPAWDISTRHQGSDRANGKVDLPRMADGNLDASFFAVFVGQRPLSPENYRLAKAKADALLSQVHRVCLYHGDLVSLATQSQHARENEAMGKLSIYIGLENGFPLAEEVSAIGRYYQQGVRYITLCHSTNNQLCDSSTDPQGAVHHGLSAFGEKAVREMNRLGMLVDVSHASDETFYDVVDLSSAPIIASHSCCRALCGHPRNLSDDMIRKLAERGGVLQMCILADYVLPRSTGRRASVRDVVDHIDHVVKLVGEDYVGIGTDFDGGGGVIGCNDVSELPNLTHEMMRRGYSEQTLRKIWGENFLRVFSRVESNATVELKGRSDE